MSERVLVRALVRKARELIRSGRAHLVVAHATTNVDVAEHHVNTALAEYRAASYAIFRARELKQLN